MKGFTGMIKSRHHKPTLWFFDLYFRWKMKFHFRKIEIIGDQVDPEKPVLLLQNHFSWWDGYWSLYLSKRFFKKKFHVMMLEEQLKKHMFINRCGAFSVRKNSKDLFHSLHYALQIIEKSENLVCFFPQGGIQSQYLSTIRFEKGASWLLKRTKQQLQVFFCVTLVDYFSKPKPILRFYLKSYDGDQSTEALEDGYNAFRNGCIEKQID